MSTSQTDTTAEATLVEIPLERLRPNPANLRRNVGDIKALTKSIAEVGIVVPLIVTPDEDGTYLLAAGERRLTAARAAGLDSAPCVVKALTEAEQVEIMLTENDDDRSALSASERAAGYLRLVSLGCTIRTLASKVGRSARHVRSHLVLLELPEQAQVAIDDGELSLADAGALAKVKDDPELVEEVLAAPAWNRRDIADTIERRQAQRRQDQACAEAIAAEEAKGHRVVPAVSGGPSKARRLRDLGFTVAEHQAEPCHGVSVERRWRDVEVVAVCDDPRRHTAKAAESTRSELQVTPATVANQSPEDRERRAERKRVLRRRAEFLADVLGRRSVPKPREPPPTACTRSWTRPAPTPGRGRERYSASSPVPPTGAVRTGTAHCGSWPSVRRATCCGWQRQSPRAAPRSRSAATAATATAVCATSRP